MYRRRLFIVFNWCPDGLYDGAAQTLVFGTFWATNSQANEKGDDVISKILDIVLLNSPMHRAILPVKEYYYGMVEVLELLNFESPSQDMHVVLILST